jgi:hypothetical protein
VHELAVLFAAFAAHGGLESCGCWVVVGGFFFLPVGGGAVVVVFGRRSFDSCSRLLLIFPLLMRLRSSNRSCGSIEGGVVLYLCRDEN